jgi:hypothetical protein
MIGNNFLQALNIERSKDADVLKKYSGIRQLLTELYPDNAHFIYELLQNAEDAQATEITFCLASEKLIVEHNATRPFTEQDIKSITSIGDSTKRNDINQIGKFGVGFKAVFSYTDTPTIYSGDYAFKIYDLIVPELITPINKQIDTTVFEFPFNNPKKPKEQAFEEIANGLRDLSETTLLFLTHIKAINWHNENEPPSFTRLHTHSEHRIEIETCLAGEETSTGHYLRFMSQIPDKPAHLQVGLAYSLHSEKNSLTFDKKTKGLVSIFFPAEKETSNFRFHIHAPFAATVARDSIKDIPENTALITAIAKLSVNSLHSIKTMGLLNRAFLDVLPNSPDPIPPFYQPISEKIWEELRNQPLIPTYIGSFAAGEQLYHATKDKDDKLKKLLDSRDLGLLENGADEILDWCVDVPEALRTKVGIKATDAEQFINKLINPPFTLSHWLELKENAWMQQFYSYLQPHSLQLKQTSLVRLNNGSHVIASKAYFPSDGIVDDKDFPRVCAATYESGNEEQQEDREQARDFLKIIGVTEVPEHKKIELVIKKWKDKNPSNQEYLAHLRQFIDYSKNDRNINVFSNKHIFWGDSKDGETHWYTAKQLFIDSPLHETGITPWFVDDPNYYLLSKKYADVPSFNVDDLVDFAKRLGAKVSAEVTDEDIQSILWRWKITKPNVTDYIKYLPKFIASRNQALFKDHAIFWGDTKNGDTHWYTAKQLFIDNPLRGTGIAAFFEDLPNNYLLSKKYADLPSFNVDDLVDFAERLGAKVDAKVTHEDIQNILSLWKKNKPNKTDYLKYLPKFIASSEHDLFKDQAIFWGDSKNGETKLDLVKASQIFIDCPLQNTSISAWFVDKNNCYLLSKYYAEHSSLDISSLIDFAKKLGAKDRLPIIQIKASEQDLYNQHFKEKGIEKTGQRIDKDWCIADNESDKDGLEQWLKNPSEAKALSIWMTMCHPNTKDEVLTACYKRLVIPYGTAKKRASRLIYALKTAAWVQQLDEAGDTIFVTPAQATLGLLPENFKYNDKDSNAWLSAIEFGKEESERVAALRRQEEQASYTYQVKNNKAQEMGFQSAERAEKWAECEKRGHSPDALLAQSQHKHAEQPEESVPNPERRRKNVLDRSENAPSKESVMRERSIQQDIATVTAEAKAYLRAKYTNANRELVCQYCQQEMPFKIDDAYYFEAVQCIKKVKNHHIENRLALCPTCAAMYQHARAIEDNELRNLLLECTPQEGSTSVKIPLTLAGKEHFLRFVGTHFFDLKTVLGEA